MAAMEEETPPVQAPMPIVQASVPLYKIIYSCPQECATKSDCINQLSSQVKELRQNIQTESSRHASELQQVHRRYQEEILKVKMDAKARSELQDSRLRESKGKMDEFHQKALKLEETLENTTEKLQIARTENFNLKQCSLVQTLGHDSELQDLKKNYDEASEERKEYYQKTLKLKEEIAKLEDSLRVKGGENEQLNAKIDELGSKNAVLEAKNETLQMQVLSQMPNQFQFEHDEVEGSIKQEIKEEPVEYVEVKEEQED